LSISRTARRADHVFILGGARSGSTLLYRLLQQHSSFRPSTPQLTEPAVFNALLTVHHRRSGRWGSMRTFAMNDLDEFGAFMRETAAWRRLLDLALPVTMLAKRMRNPRPFVALGGSVVLRDFFAHAATARGARRLLEKTPTQAPHTWKLAAAFPEARFVYLARHPVDVYDSAVRRNRRDGTGGWLIGDVNQFCKRYREWDDAVARAVADPKIAIHTLLYDDLSGSAESALRSVLEFLGETWEPELLTEVRAPAEATGLVTEAPRANNPERIVPDADVRTIERELATSMARWDFPSRLAIATGQAAL
jgi:hypothetical protein